MNCVSRQIWIPATWSWLQSAANKSESQTNTERLCNKFQLQQKTLSGFSQVQFLYRNLFMLEEQPLKWNWWNNPEKGDSKCILDLDQRMDCRLFKTKHSFSSEVCLWTLVNQKHFHLVLLFIKYSRNVFIYEAFKL